LFLLEFPATIGGDLQSPGPRPWEYFPNVNRIFNIVNKWPNRETEMWPGPKGPRAASFLGLGRWIRRCTRRGHGVEIAIPGRNLKIGVSLASTLPDMFAPPYSTKHVTRRQYGFRGPLAVVSRATSGRIAVRHVTFPLNAAGHQIP
jgi:hypothetical protein